MADRKKILFFGLGYFVRQLVREVADRRPCIAVDINPAFVEACEESPNLTVYNGDANSIVLWKKLPLDEISHIVFSLRDNDVCEELCRIARETFHLDIPIIAIVHMQSVPEFYAAYNVTTVDPLAISISSISTLIEQNYATPANIGMGKGEIVEVTIVRRSHLIGRKLRHMAATHWKVAAIYRDGDFILPGGDTELLIGDKVVLVGKPGMLSNIVNVMMQGVPQFPVQYGRHLNVYLDEEVPAPMEEANYFKVQIRGRPLNGFGTADNISIAQHNDIIASMGATYMPAVSGYDDPAIFEDAGLVITRAPATFGIFNRQMVYFMRQMTSPVLFAKGGFPYARIIVSLNCGSPATVLQVAFDISRLFNLPLRAVYVTAPKSLRNAELEHRLTERQKLIRDYENIERINLGYRIREGNPVKQLAEVAAEYPNSLFVVGNNPSQRIGIFSTHTAFLLTSRLSCSVLAVPVSEGE